MNDCGTWHLPQFVLRAVCQIRHAHILCCAFLDMVEVSTHGDPCESFTNTRQVCFTGSEAIIALCQYQWSNLKDLVKIWSLSKWLPGGHIGFFGFQSLTFVWLWISTPNFSGTILMYMGRSLLIFSYIIFKMAAWRAMFDFSVFGHSGRHGFRSISQVCFGISISNFICMLMVVIDRSLLIFSDLAFKMAA